jgi:DNA primase small subunit
MTAMDVEDVAEEEEIVGPKFDEDLLRMYYARLFPYEQMCAWLAYQPHGDPKVAVGSGPTLSRRELSFTLADDVYIRYQCFSDAAAMKAAMCKRQPHKIDIGAVFNASPKDHLSVKNFRPEERELVFDIDLSDYDDVRTCCQGATVCKKCWQYMSGACKVCEASLREDFGFQHIMWVYSGRRGVHCWVGDKESRELTNEARMAIIKYFSVVGGNENSAKKTDLQLPLHPSLERAYKLLEPIFVKHIITDEGQRLLADEAQWTKLLKTLPEEIGDQIAAHWAKTGHSTTPAQKWEALKGLCATPDKSGQSAKKQKRAQVDELWKYETVFTHCYPRLDENVSKHRNHLLKSPFAAHPKTGRVCVPFDATKCADFDPTKVVTLAKLAKQIDASTDDVPDLEKTDLKHAVRFFEKSFINPLLKSLHQDQRDEKERHAAQVGDF